MTPTTPILLLGAGRLGGALLDGWALTGAFSPADLIIRDPQPGEAARIAAGKGAVLNPPDAALGRAKVVLLAVKPQMWREAAIALTPHLAADAVIVSVAAGVRAGDLSQAFGGRPTARVMPITAVAVAQGAGAIYAADPRASSAAHALFDPVARMVDLDDEGQMDAVTAVCGSAPAYLYAFTEALEAAGEHLGLAPEAARTLARATVAGALGHGHGGDRHHPGGRAVAERLGDVAGAHPGGHRDDHGLRAEVRLKREGRLAPHLRLHRQEHDPGAAKPRIGRVEHRALAGGERGGLSGLGIADDQVGGRERAGDGPAVQQRPAEAAGAEQEDGGGGHAQSSVIPRLVPGTHEHRLRRSHRGLGPISQHGS